MAETRELVAYLNGRMVPHGQVVAEMSDMALEPDPGFYDAERTFNGRVFKLREHLERLYRSLEFAKIVPELSLDGMEEVTLEVLEANRPLLFRLGPHRRRWPTRVCHP